MTEPSAKYEIECDRCSGRVNQYRNVGYGNKCWKCHGTCKVACSEAEFRAAQEADAKRREREAVNACAAKLRELTALGAAATTEERTREAKALAAWLDEVGSDWCPNVCARFLTALRRYVETGNWQKA